MMKKLNGEQKEFVNRLVYNIKDRLKEVFGETLPRELDQEVKYIVTETFKATMENFCEFKSLDE